MPIKSLDPRVTRLGIEYDANDFKSPENMDQLETYEIFTEVKEGSSYAHVGIVHAADEKLAFLEAKEQYGRRGTCFGVWTAKTRNVLVSPYAKINENIFDIITSNKNEQGQTETYSIFLQNKRGKHHIHIGDVTAANHEDALTEAKLKLSEGKIGCNLWAIKTSDILKSTEEDKVIWATVKEKQFREPLIYKIKDRIDNYRKKHQLN